MNKDLGYLYDEEFQRDGERSKLLWGREGRAEASYESVCREIDFSGQTVLDVGCGFGGFCGYLMNINQVPLRYVGIDVKVDFINIAENRHGFKHLAEFYRADIDMFDGGIDFDYVVAIGTLVTKYMFYELATKMWKLSKKGISFNCLSKIDYKGKLVSYDPMVVLDGCFDIGSSVVMRHDYGEQEATFFVFRNSNEKV